jgi:hypothetical protein
MQEEHLNGNEPVIRVSSSGIYIFSKLFSRVQYYVDMRWDVEFNLAHEISLGIKHQ